MKTEIDTRTELKGVGKLGWFMSKTSTATSPPRQGDPEGTYTIVLKTKMTELRVQA